MLVNFTFYELFCMFDPEKLARNVAVEKKLKFDQMLGTPFPTCSLGLVSTVKCSFGAMEYYFKLPRQVS